MRVLVYLDTPRQMSYVASVQAAVADLQGCSVSVAGPGVATGYFELVEDTSPSFQRDKSRGALATRFRLGLRTARRWWGTLFRKTIAFTEPYQKRLDTLIVARLARTRTIFRSWLIGTRRVWRELRAQHDFLQLAAEGIHVFALRLGGGVRWLRSTIRAIWPIRAIRLVQKQHQRRIWRLPPVLRSIAMFWSRVTLAIAAVVSITMNSATITRQMVQRRVYIQEATGLIQAARPQVIVMMEDNAEGLTGIMTFAARKAGIPFVVLPDYIPNPVEPATYYRDSKAHYVRTLLDWMVATAYPKWTYVHNSRIMLRLPAPTILAYHLLRCDPPAPWILNSGYARAIALDSPAMLNHYCNLGFRPSKLRVIGTAQDDRLYARFAKRSEFRESLMSELGWKSGRPIVLCAFPPDQYTDADTSAFEYKSYSDLTDAWFDMLAETSRRANVIVRPHPRTAPGVLEQLCPPSVRVIRTPTEDLIPLCDIYVACVSTTIRWALGLGLPVINYDCYRYNYGDFSGAKGILECTDKVTFGTMLQEVVADSSNLAARAKSDRQAWGRVDGNYGRRLRRLLEEVSTDRSKLQATHSSSIVPGATLIRNALRQLRSQR